MPTTAMSPSRRTHSWSLVKRSALMGKAPDRECRGWPQRPDRGRASFETTAVYPESLTRNSSWAKRGISSWLVSGEAAGEEAEVCEQEPGRAAFDGCFEILGEASAAAEPGEAALDHPAPGQQLKAFDAGRPLDDFDRPGAAIVDRLLQLPAPVDAVGEDVTQLGEAARQVVQQRHRAVWILDVGLVHPHCEQQTLGVGDDMALAPLDALAGVDPARAAALGGRRALTVDNAGRRHRIASQTLPGARHQNGIEPIPGAVVAPPGRSTAAPSSAAETRS